MAAIQEIQTLISQGQPIPEGLQRNALREAAATGMSNADLASTLGVPASMVDDAAATLAATPEIGALPVDRFMPQIPAPSPLAGIAVDNNYSQQEIDQVRGLVDSGAVSIDQVAQNFGVTPNYAAAGLGMSTEGMAIENINNQSAQELPQRS